jgi:hypothetical protein
MHLCASSKSLRTPSGASVESSRGDEGHAPRRSAPGSRPAPASAATPTRRPVAFQATSGPPHSESEERLTLSCPVRTTVSRTCLVDLVGKAGFEPATPCSQSWLGPVSVGVDPCCLMLFRAVELGRCRMDQQLTDGLARAGARWIDTSLIPRPALATACTGRSGRTELGSVSEHVSACAVFGSARLTPCGGGSGRGRPKPAPGRSRPDRGSR